jgi:uncharacterized protein with HEPN domain
LNDILENIHRIEDYTKGFDFEPFAADRLRQDAVERCLSRIAEAARKLQGLAEPLAPDQPWLEIRELGNLLRHEYERIDRGMIGTLFRMTLPA